MLFSLKYPISVNNIFDIIIHNVKSNLFHWLRHLLLKKITHCNKQEESSCKQYVKTSYIKNTFIIHVLYYI